MKKKDKLSYDCTWRVRKRRMPSNVHQRLVSGGGRSTLLFLFLVSVAQFQPINVVGIRQTARRNQGHCSFAENQSERFAASMKHQCHRIWNVAHFIQQLANVNDKK
jgi:hypothetical protein